MKKGYIDTILSFTLFLFFVLFPFGQLLTFNLKLNGFAISVHLIDLIIAIPLLLYAFGIFRNTTDRSNLLPFISLGLFSLFLSVSLFPVKEVFIGLLYLVRFFAYLLLVSVTKRLLESNTLNEKTLTQSLLSVGLFVAIFGWIQYIWLPDLRALKILGWDDHLYRLVGTFLDPTFTGLILALTILISFRYILKTKGISYILIFVFLIITLAFTYSRASYLAFFFGLLYFLKNKKFVYFTVISLALFLLTLAFLPRPSGEGVKLERTGSIYAKLQNCSETYTIFIKNPVFGVGFNTLCSARVRMFNDSFSSHSCYGADSSLLFILATGGIVGLILFSKGVLALYLEVEQNKNNSLLFSSFFTVFVHSMFANSLFYPWVVGWLAILLGITKADSKDER